MLLSEGYTYVSRSFYICAVPYVRYMWLFNLKLIKIKCNLPFSFSVISATFHVPSGHMSLVAAIVDTPDIDHFHFAGSSTGRHCSRVMTLTGKHLEPVDGQGMEVLCVSSPRLCLDLWSVSHQGPGNVERETA